MKKFLFLAIVCVCVFSSVATAQTSKSGPTFSAPQLNQEQVKSSAVDIDLTVLKNENAQKEKETKIAAVVTKKQTSLQTAKETMLSEVKIALSDENQNKAFEKRSAAWKKYADAQKEAEKVYVQEILDII